MARRPDRRPQSESRQALANLQRRWLERVEEVTGLTTSEIARRAGKHHTTLTGFKNKPERGPLNSLTLQMISEATGVPLTEAARGTPAPSGMSEEAEPYVATEDNAIAVAIRALIGGRPGVDPWRLRTHALEDAGYKPGDLVIVDLNAEPKAGNAVCAQVYDWERGRAETIWRIFEPPYLIAATADRSLRKPLLVDNQQVAIKGVVLPHRLRDDVNF